MTVSLTWDAVFNSEVQSTARERLFETLCNAEKNFDWIQLNKTTNKNGWFRNILPVMHKQCQMPRNPVNKLKYQSQWLTCQKELRWVATTERPRTSCGWEQWLPSSPARGLVDGKLQSLSGVWAHLRWQQLHDNQHYLKTYLSALSVSY